MPHLLRDLPSAVETFKTENGSIKSLAAVAHLFKSAGNALDRAAPPPGQHVFLAGERAILLGLKQRSDLNGSAAHVRQAVDQVAGDGRIEVSVGSSGNQETLRVRPCNLRLEWHVAADAHAACLGHSVLVRKLDSAARGKVCDVVEFDPSASIVTVRTMTNERSPAADFIERVAVSNVVPAVYSDLAREVHSCAMKVLLKAAGAAATPAVTAVLNAVHSSASFNIRCARDDEAARTCVTVLKMLHTGTPRAGLSPKDLKESRRWTEKFFVECTCDIDQELQEYGCVNAAYAVLSQCLKVVQDTEGKDSLIVSGVLNNIAILLERCSRFDEALTMHKDALRIKKLKYGDDSCCVADSLNNLGMLYEKLGRLSDAEAMYQDTLRIRELKLGHESVDVACTLNNHALLYMKQGRLAEAETGFKEALRIQELTIGHESMEAATTLNNLAKCIEQQGRLVDAEAAFREALRIKEMILGRENSSVSDTMHSFGALLEKMGRLVDAEAMYNEALRVRKLMHGHESFAVAVTLNSLGMLFSRQNRLTDAEATHKEALRIRKLSLGHECAEVADTLNNLASVFVKQERLADGEAMYKEALRIKEKLHGHESLSVAITLSSLAALHQSQGRLAEAEAMHKEALRIEEMKLGTDALAVAQLRSSLADFHPPPLSNISPM